MAASRTSLTTWDYVSGPSRSQRHWGSSRKSSSLAIALLSREHGKSSGHRGNRPSWTDSRLTTRCSGQRGHSGVSEYIVQPAPAAAERYRSPAWPAVIDGQQRETVADVAQHPRYRRQAQPPRAGASHWQASGHSHAAKEPETAAG